jgi:predicted nucleotidyltransferase component of viral defense system
MNEIIKNMLSRYQPKDLREQKLALQEILHEIALVGLWRGNFFDHAAFYGGTALSILYGLERFLEDLDFTLRTPNKDFSWEKYKIPLITELNSYGFTADFDGKQKTV